MANGELDRVGCEYGRITRQQLEDFKRHCAAVTGQSVERMNSSLRRIEEIDEEVKELDMRLTQLQMKMAWMMGIYAAVGAFLGVFLPQLLEKLLSHL